MYKGSSVKARVLKKQKAAMMRGLNNESSSSLGILVGFGDRSTGIERLVCQRVFRHTVGHSATLSTSWTAQHQSTVRSRCARVDGITV